MAPIEAPRVAKTGDHTKPGKDQLHWQSDHTSPPAGYFPVKTRTHNSIAKFLASGIGSCSTTKAANVPI